MSVERLSHVESELPDSGHRNKISRRALARGFFCVAIPLGVWVLIIQLFTQHVKEQIPPKDNRTQVQKVEIRELDVQGFRKSLGLPSE
jgi:hypothetical protein